MDKNASIIVTGGCGFLGRALVRKMEAAGYTKIHTFNSIRTDLTKPQDVQRMFSQLEPEAVIHLAARVGGIGANQANPGKFCYENLIMGVNIIEEARQRGLKKLVIAGTICSYPKMTPVPFKESDFWNGFPSSYPEETNAPYGMAKKMLLVLANSYREQYGLNSIYMLSVNLYGPHDNFDLETSHVIPAMIRKFHEAKVEGNRDVVLWGDGSPTREFLYVDDCADAYITALDKYDGGDPINLGTGSEITMRDLATKIQQVVGHTGQIIWDSSRPNGQPRRCLDVTRAKEVLGWEAKTNFETGLKNTYDWYVDAVM